MSLFLCFRHVRRVPLRLRMIKLCIRLTIFTLFDTYLSHFISCTSTSPKPPAGCCVTKDCHACVTAQSGIDNDVSEKRHAFRGMHYNAYNAYQCIKLHIFSHSLIVISISRVQDCSPRTSLPRQSAPVQRAMTWGIHVTLHTVLNGSSCSFKIERLQKIKSGHSFYVHFWLHVCAIRIVLDSHTVGCFSNVFCMALHGILRISSMLFLFLEVSTTSWDANVFLCPAKTVLTGVLDR